MHVGSTSTSDDDDAATGRWAPCSPLDNIADSDAKLPLPSIFPTGGNSGGRDAGGVDRVILCRQGVFIRSLMFFLCDGDVAVAPHNSVKKHGTPTM